MIASAGSAFFTNEPGSRPMRFAVHGPAVEIDCAVAAVSAEVGRMFGPFAVSDWPEGFSSVSGCVRAYDTTQVVRHVPPTARPMATHPSLGPAELYEEGERFWLVDERWGMVEIDFGKGSWRSWMLPRPQLDAVRCAEKAVLWAAAQLLRPRGLHLLPAAAAVRNGWAFLLLCPLGLEPELTALARAGYKIIGQRWTAVREEDGRLALLHLPGCVERGVPPGIAPPGIGPRLRRASEHSADPNAHDRWLDVNAQHPGSMQNHAFCDAVLLADAGRRSRAALKSLDRSEALHLLRHTWPIDELHPQQRDHSLPMNFSQQCRCAKVELSRSAAELLALLDTFRHQTPATQVA